MKNMYMIYAKSGRELDISNEMRDLGLTVYCARKMVFERRGNHRRPEAYTMAYLPNYIFAEIPDCDFQDVLAINGITGQPRAISPKHVGAIHDFLAVTEAEYTTATKIKGNLSAMCKYKVGQALKCLDGGFKEAMLTFRGVIERAHDLHPKIQATTEMMGQTVTVELDPLSVRAG